MPRAAPPRQVLQTQVLSRHAPGHTAMMANLPRSTSPPPGQLGILALVLGMIGCAPALPQVPAERALVRDIARVVDVATRTGWEFDDLEIEEAAPNALKAACQTPEQSRTEAIAWVARRVDLLGGEPAALWRARDRDLGAIEELLFWSRVERLLTETDDRVRKGKCPFWLESSPNFKGVHTSAHRYLLSVEGGGRFTMERAVGQTRYGGGGSGRLLAGRTFDDRFALLFGVEFGGDARFTNLKLGQVEEFPELAAVAAAPLVGRWDFGLSTHVEVEVGPLLFIDRATADEKLGIVDAGAVPGIRFGAGIGGKYLRIQQGVIPRFTFAFTVDLIPSDNGRPTLVQLGFGARTGLDVSSWKAF